MIAFYLSESTAAKLLEARGWTVDPREGYGCSHPEHGHYWHLSEALSLSLAAEVGVGMFAEATR